MADKPPQEAADGACDEPAEKVGPGNPPRHTRFKPGQSGNPNGRPKGSKNFATILQQQLTKKITITVDGKAEACDRPGGDRTPASQRQHEGHHQGDGTPYQVDLCQI